MPNETGNQAIQVVKSKDAANYPFVVQVKATENWGALNATVTLAAAQEIVRALASSDTLAGVPIRIAHCTGGMQVTPHLPLFEHRVGDELPHRVALWTGTGEPPSYGDRVDVRVNGIGPGRVTGYAVQEGYLGVMVLADEATRPAWHKKQNPRNEAFLSFGAELQPTLKGLYGLWDKLQTAPRFTDGRLASPFHGFQAGTSREELWAWFERQDPRFVVKDVQQGIRVQA